MSFLNYILKYFISYCLEQEDFVCVYVCVCVCVCVKSAHTASSYLGVAS